MRMKNVRKYLNKMIDILKEAMVKSAKYTNNKIDHQNIKIDHKGILMRTGYKLSDCLN